MVSRASHYRAKAQHSQRELTYVKPEVNDDTSWLEQGMSLSRRLSKEFGKWGVVEFSNVMDVTPKEAERRMRVLSKMEFLTMSVQRADGKFIRYVWAMTDPNLPDFKLGD